MSLFVVIFEPVLHKRLYSSSLVEPAVRYSAVPTNYGGTRNLQRKHMIDVTAASMAYQSNLFGLVRLSLLRKRTNLAQTQSLALFCVLN